jgi:DDE family transposase
MKQGRQGRRRKKAANAAGQRDQMKQAVNGETLRSAVTWIVNEKSFENLKFHGNTTWLVCDLIILAVLWVWSDHATLTGAFAEAHGWSLKMLGRAAVDSYQGLTGALVSVTSTLMPLLWARMQSLMERHAGEYWRVAGWLPLAVDGSRVSTPRTASNEQAFCAPNYGHSAMAKYRRKKRRQRGVARRKKQAQPAKPQIWLTLVWHMGLRLLWCWRTGPSNSSERAHLQDLLKTQIFPKKTLFCGDAGFVGYDFWKAIADQGHHFLMRVGSNVTLLRKLGYVRESHDIVYCWPSKAARKNQPPLVLRLLSMRFGRTPVHLVTNILDPRELPHAAACQLYQLRWGIELQFRTIKQTFGRSKLRSKTPERALCELDWSLLGLWMIQLFAVKEQLAIGQPPTHSSAALAIHAIRDVFHHWSEIPTTGTTLKSKLRHAMTDQYQRSKKSKQARYRPDNKDKPSAGKPILITANQKHKLQLKRYLALAA